MTHPLVRDMRWDDLEAIGAALGRESRDPERNDWSQRREHTRDMRVFVERVIALLAEGRHSEATRNAAAYVTGVYPSGFSGPIAQSCITFDFLAARRQMVRADSPGRSAIDELAAAVAQEYC